MLYVKVVYFIWNLLFVEICCIFSTFQNYYIVENELMRPLTDYELEFIRSFNIYNVKGN